MELPDLVRQALGDEAVTAGVNLGDEDAVCFTPTRTLVYRGEGLLSDEGVSEYTHDFERLSVSEGRRKTKFTMTYVDDKQSFGVPGKRTSAVLERLLEGNLRVKDVIGSSDALAEWIGNALCTRRDVRVADDRNSHGLGSPSRGNVKSVVSRYLRGETRSIKRVG